MSPFSRLQQSSTCRLCNPFYAVPSAHKRQGKSHTSSFITVSEMVIKKQICMKFELMNSLWIAITNLTKPDWYLGHCYLQAGTKKLLH
jgi:hypothetical protein